MFNEGDIVEIPLRDGRTAIGWILHVSTHFKDAIGIIVFGIKGELRDEDVATNHQLKVLGPLYTALQAAEKYGWNVVRNIPLKPRDRALTRRQVGGGVYVGDEFIGSAEDLGEPNLNPMRLYGMTALARAIQEAFPPCENAAQES